MLTLAPWFNHVMWVAQFRNFTPQVLYSLASQCSFTSCLLFLKDYWNVFILLTFQNTFCFDLTALPFFTPHKKVWQILGNTLLLFCICRTGKEPSHVWNSQVHVLPGFSFISSGREVFAMVTGSALLQKPAHRGRPLVIMAWRHIALLRYLEAK